MHVQRYTTRLSRLTACRDQHLIPLRQRPHSAFEIVQSGRSYALNRSRLGRNVYARQDLRSDREAIVRGLNSGVNLTHLTIKLIEVSDHLYGDDIEPIRA